MGILGRKRVDFLPLKPRLSKIFYNLRHRGESNHNKFYCNKCDEVLVSKDELNTKMLTHQTKRASTQTD